MTTFQILFVILSFLQVHPRTFKKEYDEIVEKEGEEAFAGCHFVHDDDDGDSEGEEANSDQAMEEDWESNSNLWSQTLKSISQHLHVLNTYSLQV